MSTSPRLHVTHIASGDLWAGAEVQLYTLCKALSHIEGITVSVILLNHGTLEHKLRECAIPVKVVDESQLNAFQIGKQISQILQRLQPNVVHTHRLKENIIGGLVAKLHKIPSIRTVHGAPEHRPSWLRPHKRLLFAIDGFIGRHFQASIIAVSDELKALLEGKFPKDKIQIIENGIETEPLMRYQRLATPEQTNKQRSFKVGLVGRLVPVKRVDLFIQTAKYLCDHYPELPIQFQIYGDGPLRTELENQVRSLDLTDIVQFTGHCSQIHPEIASLDALLIPSDHEGLPMTLLEAMALGTPVVAHAVGGISKVCKNGECCWLVSKNTVSDLAHVLVDCLRDTETRLIRKKQAQRQIQTHYSADINAKSYTQTYKNLVTHTH